MKACKVCGEEISEHVAYSEISSKGDLLYVVVVGDGAPVKLQAGDSLCSKCHKVAIWYKREDG